MLCSKLHVGACKFQLFVNYQLKEFEESGSSFQVASVQDNGCGICGGYGASNGDCVRHGD